MRNLRTKTLIPLLALGLVLAGCNGESPDLDDPDDANSVLEVQTLTIPNAQASVSGTGCTIVFQNVQATLANKGKSLPGSGTPFNDIEMQSVTIRYTWDDPAIVTANRTWSLGGTVPLGGTGTVQFAPVAFGDVTTDMVGHTANLFMVFRGVAVSGESTTATGGGTLSVGGTCTP